MYLKLFRDWEQGLAPVRPKSNVFPFRADPLLGEDKTILTELLLLVVPYNMIQVNFVTCRYT